MELFNPIVEKDAPESRSFEPGDVRSCSGSQSFNSTSIEVRKNADLANQTSIFTDLVAKKLTKNS